MNVLDIRPQQRQTQFRPGDVLEGTVEWSLDKNPQSLELRLIWFTSGKGDTDVSIEDVRHFTSPSTQGKETFRFTLPPAPYSFSGKLISLSWALEMVTIPDTEAARFEFSLSPNGAEIQLPQSDDAGALQNRISRFKQMSGRLQSSTKSQNNNDSALQQRNPFD